MKIKGFTLIELIIVIVLLGILAVAILPDYMDLKSDAQTSLLEGVQSNMSGAANFVYGKSMVAGKHKLENSNVFISDVDQINIQYGYPEHEVNEWSRLLNGIDLSVLTIKTMNGVVMVYFNENGTPARKTDNCLVYYQKPLGVGLKPTIVVNPCI